jgi:hypothetical protein
VVRHYALGRSVCYGWTWLYYILGSLYDGEYRSRIHERPISLRFLGIILTMFRLEVSVWISETVGKGVWFSIRFSSFTVYK